MNALSPYARGFAITLAGVFVLCPDALLIRLVSADNWTIIFYRGALAALVLVAFLAGQYRRDVFGLIRRFDRPAAISGIMYGIGNVCFVQSINQTLVANTLVILAATPLIAAVFSQLFLGERQRRKTWWAILIVMIGVGSIFVGSMGTGHLAGDLLAIVSAIAMAGNLTALRRSQVGTPIPSVVLGGTLAALVALPFAAPTAVGSQDLLVLLALGVVILPVSFGLIFIGPRYLPAPEVALILLIEAILGPLFVWMVLGEIPGSRVLLAGAVIVGAVAIHAINSLRGNRNERKISP